MACLYRITSPSGKHYFGITVDFRGRMNDHTYNARRGIRTPLYTAIRKYGWDACTKQIIVIGSHEYVKELEVKAIAHFNTMYPHGYNLTVGGDGVTGHVPSDTTRKLMSAAHKGKRHDPEHRAKISAKMKQVCDSAWRKQRSEKQRAMWADPEYRAMMLAKRRARRVQSS